MLMKEDILLLIEPINHFDIPGFHLTGTRQALKLIDDVGCCNLKIQYDIYHMQRMEGELTNTMTQWADKIAAIGQDLGDAKEVMDASGLVVSPGMVDAHTHISEPGRSHWEGYETGTRAAAKGGITTMIEMPLNQLPATVDRASIELKFDAAKGKLTIDAAQLGGLVSYNIDRLHELDEVGVVGFKCFVATCGDRGIDNDFRDVNDWQFFKGAQKLGELGQPVLVHCENALICDALGEEAKREGRVTAHDYVASRPVFTEVEAIRRVLYLAKVAGCRF